MLKQTLLVPFSKEVNFGRNLFLVVSDMVRMKTNEIALSDFQHCEPYSEVIFHLFVMNYFTVYFQGNNKTLSKDLEEILLA